MYTSTNYKTKKALAAGVKVMRRQLNAAHDILGNDIYDIGVEISRKRGWLP